MPYIKSVQRAKYDALLDALCRKWGSEGALPGDLNYIITYILNNRFQQEPRYGTVNELIGVLECAKLEMYRKLAAPYEDAKAKENGTAYVSKAS